MTKEQFKMLKHEWFKPLDKDEDCTVSLRITVVTGVLAVLFIPLLVFVFIFTGGSAMTTWVVSLVLYLPLVAYYMSMGLLFGTDREREILQMNSKEEKKQ